MLNQYIEIFIDILSAVPLTCSLAVIILVISYLGGIVTNYIYRKKIVLVSGILKFITSLLRGTPLLVQLFIWYFTFPRWVNHLMDTLKIPWKMGQFSSIAIIVFSYSLYYISYQQETVKGAFASIDQSQRDLGKSLGYNSTQIFWRITFFQSLAYALPNLLNTFLGIMKALSLAFTIEVVDIFAKAKLISSLKGNYIMVFFIAAFVYWLVCMISSKIVHILEKKVRING